MQDNIKIRRITLSPKATHTLRVKIRRHSMAGRGSIFTISLPVICGACNYPFIRRVQVGVNDPIIPCPVCYTRSYLKLTWKLKENTLADGDVVKEGLLDFDCQSQGGLLCQKIFIRVYLP